jgi:hypothetical protein
MENIMKINLLLCLTLTASIAYSSQQHKTLADDQSKTTSAAQPKEDHDALRPKVTLNPSNDYQQKVTTDTISLSCAGTKYFAISQDNGYETESYGIWLLDNKPENKFSFCVGSIPKSDYNLKNKTFSQLNFSLKEHRIVMNVKDTVPPLHRSKKRRCPCLFELFKRLLG